MHQVQLADNLYQEAQLRARIAGFATVDEYVADVLAADLHTDDLAHLFTRERLADLDRVADIATKDGANLTPAQVRKRFQGR